MHFRRLRPHFPVSTRKEVCNIYAGYETLLKRHPGLIHGLRRATARVGVWRTGIEESCMSRGGRAVHFFLAFLAIHCISQGMFEHRGR